MAARKRRRSTRKGMIRKTSRRAYMPKTRRARRRRSNPVGLTGTPAFRFAAYAVGGAVAFSAVKASGLGAKTIPNELTRSLVFAAATIALAGLAKGKTKSNLIALGVGMTTVPLVKAADKQLSNFKLLPGMNGNGNGNGSTAQVESLEARRLSRAALRSNAYAVGMQHSQQVAAGGLGSF